jgi:hypothetical protein
MADEKIYCGSGKSHPSYDIVNIDVCLGKIPKEFISEDKNGNKWLKLTVSKKKEVDQWGKSHTVTVNTWKPNTATADDTPNTATDNGDLPF